MCYNSSSWSKAFNNLDSALNVANRNGGAIREKNADLVNITLSRFANNSVVGTAIGDESGGAVGSINSSLNVIGSSFDSNNSGPIAGGGAIFFHTVFESNDVYTLNVNASIFNNNHAASVGGVYRLDPANLGNSPNGVQLIVTGGVCTVN